MENTNIIREWNERCYYCQGNHILLQCSDSRLQRFEVLCRAKKYDYEYSQDGFKNWIRDYYNNETDENKKMIVCFAIKNTTAFSGERINEIINKITDFIFENRSYRNSITEQGGEEDFLAFSNYDDEEEQQVVLPERYWHQRVPRKSIEIVLYPKPETSMKYDCGICLECKPESKIVSLNCNHNFCESCVEKILKNDAETKCAYCRCNTTHITVTNAETHNKYINIIN